MCSPEDSIPRDVLLAKLSKNEVNIISNKAKELFTIKPDPYKLGLDNQCFSVTCGTSLTGDFSSGRCNFLTGDFTSNSILK